MRKLFTTFVFCSLVASCFAPIRTAAPKGWVPPREATQAEMQQAQGRQEVVGEVGFVPQKTDEVQTNSATSSAHAANTLAKAGHMEAKREEEQAKQALTAAQRQVEAEKGAPMRFGTIAIIVGALGFGIVFALRRWTEKAMGDLPTVSSVPVKKDASW